MKTWRSRTPQETRELGARLAEELVPSGTLLLVGELGSGKTVLVQGLANGLGIDPGQVQSPTFTLIREHGGGNLRLIHVDLYRLEPGEAGALGLEEIVAGPGVKAIEWAERLPFSVPGATRLRFERTASGERVIYRDNDE